LIGDGSTTAVFTGTELHAWKWTTKGIYRGTTCGFP